MIAHDGAVSADVDRARTRRADEPTRAKRVLGRVLAHLTDFQRQVTNDAGKEAERRRMELEQRVHSTRVYNNRANLSQSEINIAREKRAQVESDRLLEIKLRQNLMESYFLRAQGSSDDTSICYLPSSCTLEQQNILSLQKSKSQEALQAFLSKSRDNQI